MAREMNTAATAPYTMALMVSRFRMFRMDPWIVMRKRTAKKKAMAMHGQRQLLEIKIEVGPSAPPIIPIEVSCFPSVMA